MKVLLAFISGALASVLLSGVVRVISGPTEQPDFDTDDTDPPLGESPIPCLRCKLGEDYFPYHHAWCPNR